MRRIDVQPASRQLITLAVDDVSCGMPLELIRSILGTTQGVQWVERDPRRSCVWVFANGMVDPDLCEALGSWGVGAYAMTNQFTRGD
jgi:hypothetical protein